MYPEPHTEIARCSKCGRSFMLPCPRPGRPPIGDCPNGGQHTPAREDR